MPFACEDLMSLAVDLREDFYRDLTESPSNEPRHNARTCTQSKLSPAERPWLSPYSYSHSSLTSMRAFNDDVAALDKRCQAEGLSLLVIPASKIKESESVKDVG